MKTDRHSGRQQQFGACRLALASVVLGLASCPAWADGFRNPPAGAAALSRDGGKVAYIDDASAVTVNPANLVDVKENVLISATYIYGKSDLHTPLGSYSTRGNSTVLPNLFGVLPLGEKGDTVIGLGITTPFGQSVEWPSGVGIDNFYSEMVTVDIGPTLAMRLGKTVSVALGVDVYLSDLELKSTTSGSTTVPDGTTVKLTGDGVGVGANAAITWQVTDNQRLSCVYRSPFSVEYSGDTEILIAGVPSSDFNTEIDFPTIVTLAYGIQLTDALRLGADVEWLEFSRNEALTMDYGLYNAYSDFSSLRVIPQNWDDTWTVGVSGSWRISEQVTARGGYKYLESPIPDETLSTALPDADMHAFTAGLGWRGEKDAVDVAYMYGLREDRDVVSGGIPLTYEQSSHIASVSYSHTF